MYIIVIHSIFPVACTAGQGVAPALRQVWDSQHLEEKVIAMTWEHNKPRDIQYIYTVYIYICHSSHSNDKHHIEKWLRPMTIYAIPHQTWIFLPTFQLHTAIETNTSDLAWPSPLDVEVSAIGTPTVPRSRRMAKWRKALAEPSSCAWDKFDVFLLR